MEKTPVLVSACLLGLACRYDGKSKQYKEIGGLEESCALIPVCPEQMGGLATPRLPAERKNGRVVTENGLFLKPQYERGGPQLLYLSKPFPCR